MTFLLFHPVALIALQVLITSIVIGFISPSSIIRPAILPLTAAATWLIIRTCTHRITQLSLASIVAGNGPTYLLHYLDLVLLSRWNYEMGGPANPQLDPQTRNEEKKKNDENSHERLCWTAILSRLRFGLYVTLSPRKIDTSWEVKNVPHFSSQNPAYNPPRGTFLRQTAITFLACFFSLDLFSLTSSQSKENSLLFSHHKVPFFRRFGTISAEDVAIRLISSLFV